MGQRTPLYDLHLALGAKMVDFGGWDMPLHYGSQVEEHHQVRRDCGVFDVSHMTVIDVNGPQAKAWLQYLLANDVERLHSPGRALYSAMLNEQRRHRRRHDRLPSRGRLSPGGQRLHPQSGSGLDAGSSRRLRGAAQRALRVGDAGHSRALTPGTRSPNW